jgi:tetratricopeptide (TPR) repeat protein
MKRARFILALAVAASILLPAGAARGDTDAPAQLFARGVAAYDEGRFAAAEESFAALADRGLHQAAVYHNLGCAQARQGAFGAAVLSFRRALRYDPRHADTRANLAWVRDRLPDAAPPPRGPGDLLARAAALVPVRGGLLAALALELAAAALAGAAVLRRLRRRPARRLAGSALALAALAALAAAGPATTLALRAAEDDAVVTAQRVDARSGPGPNHAALFSVHAGLEVEVLAARRGWMRLAVPDGPSGWVPCEAVAPVDPGRRLCRGVEATLRDGPAPARTAAGPAGAARR